MQGCGERVAGDGYRGSADVSEYGGACADVDFGDCIQFCVVG